jgi:protein-tyrosine kinase
MSLVEKALKRMADAKAAAQREDRTLPAQKEQSEAVAEQGFQPRSRVHTLNYSALRNSGVLPAEHERKMFSQIFRGIKRPILASTKLDADSAPDSRANVVMIASALPGDGKTFVSVNLALSIAMERHKYVVLIDGDVIKRQVSTMMDMADEPGLLDALQEKSGSIEKYLIQTDLPNLAILPAGSPSIRATELLASSRMRELMDELAANQGCLAILDSPPLLQTSESGAIAEFVGQAVLVVREGETTRSALLQSLEKLKACPSTSLILNQSLTAPNSGYGYDYAETKSAQPG